MFKFRNHGIKARKHMIIKCKNKETKAKGQRKKSKLGGKMTTICTRINNKDKKMNDIIIIEFIKV
jgi:hypothetical protein